MLTAMIVNAAPSNWEEAIIAVKIIIVPIVDFSTGFDLAESIFFPLFFKKICSKGIISIIPKIIRSRIWGNISGGMLLENKSGTFSNLVVSNYRKAIIAIITIAMIVSFLLNNAPRLLGAVLLFFISIKPTTLG